MAAAARGTVQTSTTVNLQLYLASAAGSQHAFQVSLRDVDGATLVASTTLLATFSSSSPAWFTVTLPLPSFATGTYFVSVEKRTEAFYGVMSLYRAVVTAAGSVGGCSCRQSGFASAAQPVTPILRLLTPSFTTGSLRALGSAPRRVEFIGDSVTTGYGTCQCGRSNHVVAQ